ncbi:MAG TPA: HemK2/MTQ2 family protein methyltransferase [Pseudonocardiaceae bacterium]
MWLLRVPGVYRPQADTWLLARALGEAGVPAGGRVLDIGTGTGALALTAALAGAASVTAVDISRRAVLTARLNAALRRLPVRVHHGDVRVTSGPFDVVLANPPYVPAGRADLPTRGRARAWDAGLDGRAVIDRLCAAAPALVAPGGMLLLVHSALCGVRATLDRLELAGLHACVIGRHLEPFGPVLRARRDLLRSRRLITDDQQHEELVVIRADHIPPTAADDRLEPAA